jgi:hypothetical protein
MSINFFFVDNMNTRDYLMQCSFLLMIYHILQTVFNLELCPLIYLY